MSGYLELGAYWTEWEETVEMGLTAAQTLGDRFGEATCLSILGDAAWRGGRPHEAIERYERTAGIGHEIGVGWIEGFGSGNAHEFSVTCRRRCPAVSRLSRSSKRSATRGLSRGVDSIWEGATSPQDISPRR